MHVCVFAYVMNIPSYSLAITANVQGAFTGQELAGQYRGNEGNRMV